MRRLVLRMGEVFDTGGGLQVFRASISRPAASGIGELGRSACED